MNQGSLREIWLRLPFLEVQLIIGFNQFIFADSGDREQVAKY